MGVRGVGIIFYCPDILANTLAYSSWRPLDCTTEPSRLGPHIWAESPICEGLVLKLQVVLSLSDLAYFRLVFKI